jgi:hypothetical protein
LVITAFWEKAAIPDPAARIIKPTNKSFFIIHLLNLSGW